MDSKQKRPSRKSAVALRLLLFTRRRRRAEEEEEKTTTLCVPLLAGAKARADIFLFLRVKGALFALKETVKEMRDEKRPKSG